VHEPVAQSLLRTADKRDASTIAITQDGLFGLLGTRRRRRSAAARRTGFLRTPGCSQAGAEAAHDCEAVGAGSLVATFRPDREVPTGPIGRLRCARIPSSVPI
jgi:hypothetical protein